MPTHRNPRPVGRPVVTPHQADAIQRLAQIILDTVKAQKPLGAHERLMFITLSAQGCTPDQFQTIMTGLEQLGKVRRDGDVYHHVSDLEWPADPDILRYNRQAASRSTVPAT